MFLPYFTTVCSETEPPPSRWLLVMHGIYGRGGNWRRVARRLTTLAPEWGVLLVDLRMHGKSMDAPGPHTLAACAADVLALIDAQVHEGRPVHCVLGHSFGGKVGLQMRAERPDLCPLWLIDSGPGPREGAMTDPTNTVVSVLRMLEALPKVFEDREAFVRDVQSYGFPGPLAQWLAMNLERCEGGYCNALDPAALSELLSDYFDQDLWGVLEAAEAPIHIAIATRGSVITSEDRQRFDACAHVHAHDVEGGHWLHVDALEPLVALIATSLE